MGQMIMIRGNSPRSVANKKLSEALIAALPSLVVWEGGAG